MITVECSGGRHPFWPTGCSPCFQRIPSPLWGSSPALPLGSAGNYNTHMAIGGWMMQNIKGEPGVGDPGLWDRHKLLLHIFRGERQGERLPEPKKGRTDVGWSSLNAGIASQTLSVLLPVGRLLISGCLLVGWLAGCKFGWRLVPFLLSTQSLQQCQTKNQLAC